MERPPPGGLSLFRAKSRALTRRIRASLSRCAGEGLKQRASRLLPAPLLSSGRGRRAAPGEAPAFPTNQPALTPQTSSRRAGRLLQTPPPAPPGRAPPTHPHAPPHPPPPPPTPSPT